MSIDLEKIEGIGAKTAEQLKEEGIMNAMILASTSVKRLKSLGIGDASARKYIEKAREVIDKSIGGSFGFVMGDELLKQFKNRMTLKTGQPALDLLLGGGFETQKVYELYGPQGSGKSSLLHQLICISKLPVSEGGLGSPATIFLDCEGAMSEKRFHEMAGFWGLEPEEVIKSVARAQPATSDALVFLCEENLAKIMEQTGAKLILLDSIATHFRCEYGSARQMFPERQQKANQVIHALKRMAVNYNALAILTNQVTGNVNRPNQYAPEYTHSMGYTVGHESQVRILLQPLAKNIHKVKIEKAVDLPNKFCKLVMTQYGLLDPTVAVARGVKPPDKSEEIVAPKPKAKNKPKEPKKEADVSEIVTKKNVPPKKLKETEDTIDTPPETEAIKEEPQEENSAPPTVKPEKKTKKSKKSKKKGKK